MTARKTAIRTAEKSRVRQALQWRTRLSHRRRNLCTQPTVTVPHLFSTDRPTSIPSVNGLPRSPMEPAQCIVPGTTEVGYAFDGDQAVLVATREIEVDFGQGLFERYRLEVPLT